MILEHFDQGRAAAVENMALDLLLLEAFPRGESVRLRHYSWEPDCFTFGYSQHYEWIAGQAIRGAQLARRPTGGGLVDHRNDWTYALVLPAGHPLHHAHAIGVYRMVHQAIAEALQQCGRKAGLQPPEGEIPEGFPRRVRGLCFAGAEECDVIDPDSGVKIAGAAMKRNKFGLLMQGSIDRIVAGELDWTAFGKFFVEGLCRAFVAEGREIDAPEYPAGLAKQTTASMADDRWLRRR